MIHQLVNSSFLRRPDGFRDLHELEELESHSVIITCCVIHCVVLCDLLCCVSAVSTESRVTAVVVQEGDDLILQVDDEVPEVFYYVNWRFNDRVSLGEFLHDEEPEVSPEYSGKIEFIRGRFSVKLKNLQLADSGVYTARGLTVKGDHQQLATYKVTVQESRVTAVAVQEGDDLILQVHEEVPEDFYYVYWRFNDGVGLVVFSHDEEPEVTSEYTGKIEFSEEGFSVKLKNLQLADSGDYSARVLMAKGDQRLVKYKVTVQGEFTFQTQV
ncbi:hypothetical protein EYF80_067946 [Liparis tanakae]|uniref:Immunoglobulin domain-containing protein n=1 Tax=Liparis tanakae TaxID=230148 RepID=A0A4Z2E0M3_9TELE|nr:hypothetical protein EYF80_067946 [Liparis tanakae]